MALKDRLANASAKLSNKGCLTCRWLQTLSSEDRDAFNEWLDDGKSMRQLWEVCYSDAENPIPIKLGAFQDHVRNCR